MSESKSWLDTQWASMGGLTYRDVRNTVSLLTIYRQIQKTLEHFGPVSKFACEYAHSGSLTSPGKGGRFKAMGLIWRDKFMAGGTTFVRMDVNRKEYLEYLQRCRDKERKRFSRLIAEAGHGTPDAEYSSQVILLYGSVIQLLNEAPDSTAAGQVLLFPTREEIPPLSTELNSAEQILSKAA